MMRMEAPLLPSFLPPKQNGSIPLSSTPVKIFPPETLEIVAIFQWN
jgi:hypothetical protein